MTESRHSKGTYIHSQADSHAFSRLIAAAPDLLEATKAALEAFDDSGGNYELAMPVIKQMLAAIARAEGAPDAPQGQEGESKR